MDLVSWLMIGLLGGAFLFGIWFMLVRKDDRASRSMTIQRQDLTRRGSPDFSKAHNDFDRKLAEIERHLASKRRDERAILLAEEEARKSLADDAAKKLIDEEKSRLAEEEAEEARLKAEYEAQREAELEEARKLAEEREAERLAEEKRLAEEREIERQQELEEAEEVRQAEIEASEESEELEAQMASEQAERDLMNRLEREGAKSSEVQVSLMWDNYNDLDLHVLCPSGERIHGGNKTSECGGELDVDANVRPETKKPVENIVWPDFKAPPGDYKVYVHHYKKHNKRRSKDPTKFRVVCNTGGTIAHYESELSHGDPIMLVCEFTLDAPDERGTEEEIEQAIMEEETEKIAEEERLATELEETRQIELAEAEEQRLAEIVENEAAELESIKATQEAMKELKERLEREGAKSSDVQISLIWNNYNDLDLHVVCPSGERIHGGNRESACGGELDVDANVRPESKKPVENVVWPEGKAPGGTYKAYVHHYKKHKKRRSKDPTSFKVICNAGGEIKEFEGMISSGDAIMLISEFTIDDPEKRAAQAAEAKAKLAALESGEWDGSDSDEDQ
ncbi:MAG: hypothetical protein HOE76_06075 [Euryarchaeota archaeon]|jgi:uncharacterized protein YfaP (DUF2135 family)|nr:hypothetical protein [Euryarchaeota archaeon]MBT4982863.1 hypothetical protein [Euryarchaeota archaeon]